MIKRKADIQKNKCVACGCCVKVCPLGAITIIKGIYAQVDESLCIGCRRCEKECPATVIFMKENGDEKK